MPRTGGAVNAAAPPGASEALLGPVFSRIVVLPEPRRHILRQHHPWLLHGEDMDVGRQAVRLVECTHAHEADRVSSPSIVAPQREVAGRAAQDLLPLPLFVGVTITDGLPATRSDAIRFNHRVERERCAGLALTPSAVAAVHEQRSVDQSIANLSAATPPSRESAGYWSSRTSQRLEDAHCEREEKKANRARLPVSPAILQTGCGGRAALTGRASPRRRQSRSPRVLAPRIEDRDARRSTSSLVSSSFGRMRLSPRRSSPT